MLKVVGVTAAGVLASKSILGDLYLGQNQQQPVHIWQEAKYDGSITRDVNDDIETITLAKPKGNQVTTINRVGGNLSSFTTVYDGETTTVTLSRDGNDNISGWTVS